MNSLPKLTTKPYAAKSTTGSSSGTAILSIFQRSPNKNASYLMAAEAAHNGAEKSASYAAEAVSDTIGLSEMIESKKIPRRVAQAVNDLEREAARQRWTDESAVSPTVFTKPSKPRRPWWKFW
ncbi:MAG TPA: hypothetical protein VFW87_13425 [Pirellulales bacterium]|nr:hypothetical protein [Pirellulales bacterium]